MTSTRIALRSSAVTSSVTGPPSPYLTELVISSETSRRASGIIEGSTIPVRESIADRAWAGARRSRVMSTRRMVLMRSGAIPLPAAPPARPWCSWVTRKGGVSKRRLAVSPQDQCPAHGAGGEERRKQREKMAWLAEKDGVDDRRGGGDREQGARSGPAGDRASEDRARQGEPDEQQVNDQAPEGQAAMGAAVGGRPHPRGLAAQHAQE